jgi:hypothetical protein
MGTMSSFRKVAGGALVKFWRQIMSNWDLLRAGKAEILSVRLSAIPTSWTGFSLTQKMPAHTVTLWLGEQSSPMFAVSEVPLRAAIGIHSCSLQSFLRITITLNERIGDLSPAEND